MPRPRFDSTSIGIPAAPNLVEQSRDILEIALQLFGWEVLRKEDHPLVEFLDGSSTRASVLWRLASRWSPPDQPVCVILRDCLGPHGRQLWRVEAAIVLGPARARVVDRRLCWTCPTDAWGYPDFDHPSLEHFIAHLGCLRSRPMTAVSAIV